MERPSVESIFQALAVDIQAEAELFAHCGRDRPAGMK